MTNKHLINPAKPDQIVKELFNGNNDIVDEFSKIFSSEILSFAEEYASGYKKYMELNRLAIATKNKQKACVENLSYLLFENLLTSFKLFVLGYQIPSGNMMRHVIENVCLAILCSLEFDIVVKKSNANTKRINFFQSFVNQKPEAQSHKAIRYLEINSKAIGVKQDAIDSLKDSRSFYHKYSHPSFLCMANIMSFRSPGETYMGGSFDPEKVNGYKKELVHRVNFCRILPDFIDGLIFRVKKLPDT